MVSLNLFQRGLLYFTVQGGNFLPLLKIGMDDYFLRTYYGELTRLCPFPAICMHAPRPPIRTRHRCLLFAVTNQIPSHSPFLPDFLHTANLIPSSHTQREWTIYTELGCADVIALLTWILIAFHTLLAIFYFVRNCGSEKGSPDFLAGIETGCCGAGAVFMSLGAYDVEVEVHRKQANPKWRRGFRAATAIFHFVIVVFACGSIRIVTGFGDEAIILQQRTSLFVLLFVLFLNIFTMFEHVFEGLSISW
ncbi:hypothetical protein HDU83_003574 [Entophlyctis luteolus]|nr:hypothetical protein HDU83_003574 [Entophlyctis luteolus]